MSDLSKRLISSEAMSKGHFVLSGGAHSEYYFDKREILKDPKLAREISAEIAEHFAGSDVEVVVGIATGAIVLSHLVALELSELTRRDVLGIWTEKEGPGFKLPQTWDKLLKNKKVLIVEDVISTGRAVKETAAICRKQGADIVGIGVILNRGRLSGSDFDNTPLYSIVEHPIDTWLKKECILCQREVPISTEVGHGRQYLQGE